MLDAFRNMTGGKAKLAQQQSTELETLIAAGKMFGVTVNDLFLAAIAQTGVPFSFTFKGDPDGSDGLRPSSVAEKAASHKPRGNLPRLLPRPGVPRPRSSHR
jgi:hypothetical protein